MNNVVLIGRMVKDPELKKLEKGTSIVKFTVAVNRMRKDDPADFLRCVAFGNVAKLIGEHFNKGSRIGIQGRIQTGSYTKDDGTVVYATDIMVNQVEFLESKKKEEPKILDDVKLVTEEDDDDEFPF